MNSGIPKVPSAVPGDDNGSWIELENRLAEEKFLFLTQPIETEVTNRLISQLLYQSWKDPQEDLYLFINSSGGAVLQGLSIIDTMSMVAADVQTICIGHAGSMASLILASGAKGKRHAYPNATIMVHQPWSTKYRDKIGRLVEADRQMRGFRKRVMDIYEEKTGTPNLELIGDTIFERDEYLTPKEAKCMRIVDHVGGPRGLGLGYVEPNGFNI